MNAPFRGVTIKFLPQKIHLHVSPGGDAKNGTSCGLAMVLAIYSILSNKPIRKGLAVTGEIDLFEI